MSMTIQMRYAGLARNETGKRLESLQLKTGSNIYDLMGILEDRYGKNIGDPGEFIVVHNNRGCPPRRWRECFLQDGDAVLIISNISGG